MARTQLSGSQVTDGSIQRSDLDVVTAGSAVIRKAIAGVGISLTSTGPDAGTGDVTITATGASGGSGAVLVDFGAFPGTDSASVVITGQSGIISTSNVYAWVAPAVTADHSVDEHFLIAPQIYVSTIVAGTGFTITAVALEPDTASSVGRGPVTYGKFNLNWRY